MKKENALFLIFPVSQCMIVMGNFIGYRYLNLMGYMGVALGAAADVVLFYILVRGSKKEEVERELEEIRYQRETEHIQMKMLEERKKNLLSMQEEFKKRFQAVNEGMNKGNMKEARQELEELQERLEEIRPDVYCQNIIVNAVLNEKKKVCEKLGGTLDIHVNIPSDMEIEPFHLCSIFANLMDNAIEAVRELEQQKRLIEVSADMKGNYLFIRVKNGAVRKHVERKRREGHGNGIPILKDIVKRYEGTYKAEYKDDVYTAVLMVKAI